MKHNSKLGKKYSLTLLTCITACMAFIMLCISISTDNWLSTFERESDDNGTTVTAIHSGLWRQCKQSQYLPDIVKKTTWNDKMKTFPSNELVNCSYIKYFKGKQGGLAEIKPSEAILTDMQPAAFFPTTGLLGLLTGCILSFLSYCDQKVKKLIFVGGGLFVLSGIFMLVGIVLYVGSISQAFDSTAGNLDSDEKYVYDYGGSFYFSVVSFILTEFSGIFAIYLYIAKHRHYLRLKREKNMAHSQSVNSCVGLVPSISRFSFETPQEQLVNSIDFSSARGKPDHDLSASTLGVEWRDGNIHNNHCSQSQLLGSNVPSSKVIMSSAVNDTQNDDKLYRLPVKGNSKHTACMDIHSAYTLPRPATLFYEDEIGETSFGYVPRTEYNTTDGRVFYDNTYYVDSQHIFDGRQTLLMSPDRGIISSRHNLEEPYQTKRIMTSSNEPFRNIHILSSLIDQTALGKEVTENHCNCAQIDMSNHLSTANDSSHLICPPHNMVLPHNSLSSGVSSRKITSV